MAPYFGGCISAGSETLRHPCSVASCRPVSSLSMPGAVHAGLRALREVPAAHVDLLMRPVHGMLTTMMPDVRPDRLWCRLTTGECACVNTMRERQRVGICRLTPKV